MVEIATNPVQEKVSLTTSWVKTVIFVLVGLGLVVGNFLMENSFAKNRAVQVTDFQAFDYGKDNIIADNGLVRFVQNDPLVQSVMLVRQIKDKNYLFELESGKFWADFSVNNARVNFLIGGKVVLIPQAGVFDVAFDGSRIELNVYDGDVYVGFLADGVELRETVDIYSGLFINNLLVPRENQVSIPLKKVSAAIKPLLYSKLIKEFKFGSLPDELKNSDWVKENLKADTKFIANVKQEYVADVLYGGPKVKNDLINKFLSWTEKNLTFVPDKNSRIDLNYLFAYLEDAIFYAGQGEISKSAASMQAFDIHYGSMDSEVVESAEFNERLDVYIDRLVIFDPDDKEYKILIALLADKFSRSSDKYAVVAQFWRQVYRGLNTDEALAEYTLNNYYEYFDKIKKSGAVDANFHKTYLDYQNQLFDNLLMKYPLFYKDGYFAIKGVLEQDLLALYKNGRLKEELEQALVSNKINFLKRLKKFFFDGELEVRETKEIFKRLFGEIDSLMAKNDAGLAIVELFERQLDDMDDFWGYLNTSEYHAKTYGATHEDRFKTYLQERETIWNFINIKEDVLGEPIKVAEDITVVDVVEEIKTALESNENVSLVEVDKFDKVDLRYIGVDLVLGGYPVEALFDRDNGTLKDVKVYEEVISDRAVKVESLLGILQEKFADLADKETKTKDDDKETIETAAQRFARTYISRKINEFGFDSTLENVKIVDQLNATYRVENVMFKGLDEMKVTFDILMSGELATNVFVTVKGKSRVLDGQYSFEELATMVQAEYDFSVEIKAPAKAGSDPKIPNKEDDTDVEDTDGLPTEIVPR